MPYKHPRYPPEAVLVVENLRGNKQRIPIGGKLRKWVARKVSTVRLMSPTTVTVYILIPSRANTGQ